MRPWQPLQPDELDDPGHGYEDVAAGSDALRIGRELESAAILDPVQPRSTFSDSVMEAIAREPSPRASVAIAGPIRSGGLRGFVASVRSAVAMVTLGTGRPFGARAAAFGYLVVVAALGLAIGGGAAVGTAGALGLFDGRAPDSTPVVLPSPSTSPDAGVTPSPSPSPSPSSSVEPSASPEPSGSPGASTSPGPGTSHSPSPSSSESPDASDTPEPSRTPKPSDTPDPPETPNP